MMINQQQKFQQPQLTIASKDMHLNKDFDYLQQINNQNMMYLKLMDNIEMNTLVNNFNYSYHQQLIQQNNLQNSILHSMLTIYILQNTQASTEILLNSVINNQIQTQNQIQQIKQLNNNFHQAHQNHFHNNTSHHLQQFFQLQQQQNLSHNNASNNSSLQFSQPAITTGLLVQNNEDDDSQSIQILENFEDIANQSENQQDIDDNISFISFDFDFEAYQIQNQGLDQNEIKQLPLYRYYGKKIGFVEEKVILDKKSKKIKKVKVNNTNQKGQEASTNETCCICISHYKKGSKIRELPCKHKFHKKCIDRWLKKNRKCPYCKQTVKA